jgi:hypothetical protein
MKTKPFSIKLIAFAYFFTPLANILMSAWVNHWPLTGPRAVYQHFNFSDWFILSCFPIVALAIYRASRLGNIFFLSFSMFMIVYSSYSYLYNPIYSLYVVLLFNIATLGVVGFFLQKHIWAAYYDPAFRWWEHPYRYKTELKVEILIRQIVIDARVLDISSTGCFIETTCIFSLSEPIELSFLSVSEEPVLIEAQIVWLRNQELRGYGVEFKNLGKNQRLYLKDLIASIKLSGKVEKFKNNSSDTRKAKAA